VIRPAILLAKHRNSSSLDVKDLALILERQWDIRVPNVHGTVPRPPPPYVRPPVHVTPFLPSSTLFLALRTLSFESELQKKKKKGGL
jgi:hypothetical protein